MNNKITVVSGLGRCGTSMMMNMLYTGGLGVVAQNYKAFEDERTAAPDVNTFFDCLEEARGKAVKILDPHKSFLAMPQQASFIKTEFDLQFIFLMRDHGQQGKSQAKFMNWAGGMSLNRDAARALAGACRRETPTALNVCKALGDVYICKFEDVLKSPKIHAAAIAERFGMILDIDAAASVVVPRKAGCLPYMLEETL